MDEDRITPQNVNFAISVFTNSSAGDFKKIDEMKKSGYINNQKITLENIDFLASTFRRSWTINMIAIVNEMRSSGYIQNEKILRLLEKDDIELKILELTNSNLRDDNQFKYREQVKGYGRYDGKIITDYEQSIVDERNKDIDKLKERLKSYGDI